MNTPNKKRAVNRFMLVLTTLYSLDNKAFAEATESLHGRTRVYFAEDSRILLKVVTRPNPNRFWYTVVGYHQYEYRS